MRDNKLSLREELKNIIRDIQFMRDEDFCDQYGTNDYDEVIISLFDKRFEEVIGEDEVCLQRSVNMEISAEARNQLRSELRQKWKENG